MTALCTSLLLLLSMSVTAQSFDLKNLENIQNIVPVAIIGGGPAGLCAGTYVARAKIHTVVFMGQLPGGQLTTTSYVENWPGIKKKLGHEIMLDAQTQAEEAGAHIKYETIEKIDCSTWPYTLYTSERQVVRALTIIIATGASPRKLSIPGESLYWGKGISTCAVCDCLFFKDKVVYIVGGGDVAMEHVMQLAPYARKVTVLVRADRMRATPLLQDKLKDYAQVQVIYNKYVTQALGDGATLQNLEIADSRTGKKEIVPADGLFLAIGQNPNTALFSSVIKLTPTGYIEVNPKTQETSVRGIFAAGDVEDPEYRQAVVALADGCKAGLNTVSFLRHLGLTEVGYNRLKLYK